MPRHTTHRTLRRGVPLLAAALLLSACATPGSIATPDSAASGTTAPTRPGGNAREASSASTRILISHDQGLTLLNATTGEAVQETARPGFLRLNNAGDGRHILVTEGDQFLVYDAGIKAMPHGDHEHHYTYDAGLTDVSYAADHAVHVVAHDGYTTLFADGSGVVQSIATDDCPGVHGEATAADDDGDVALLGCTNGPVVWRDGAFHKVTAPDTYARTGNASGSDVSPIVLTYDGSVKVIDPTSGEVTASIAAIGPWEEKDNWQDPGPAIKVSGDRAYVTDAEANKLVVIDLTTRNVTSTFTLDHTPVEIAVVNGSPEDEGAEH